MGRGLRNAVRYASRGRAPSAAAGIFFFFKQKPAYDITEGDWSSDVCSSDLHGYDEDGATCPLGGAVTGFAKAYRKEQPDTLVKAVDFAVSRKTAALADLLAEETLRDPGCVEVGYHDGRRWGVALAEQPFGDGDGAELGTGTTFVVTGAAGSIVSAITADLATASHGTFHLLDLTPAPDPADAD